MEKDAELSKFLLEKLESFDYEKVYFEFPNTRMDLLHYRDIMEVPNSKVYYYLEWANKHSCCVSIDSIKL